MELSLDPAIVLLAARLRPDSATLVPEKRMELTTEGGLDVVRHFAKIQKAVGTLSDRGIDVSLFVDPQSNQIKSAQKTGAGIVELHTGVYATARTSAQRSRELKKLRDMAQLAASLGLMVSAGHGLKYHNTRAVAQLEHIEELNIGHSIISRAVFVGLEKAVREMVQLVK